MTSSDDAGAPAVKKPIIGGKVLWVTIIHCAIHMIHTGMLYSV